MLIDERKVELCHSHPGGQPELTIEAQSRAFVDWHRGARTWRNVLGTGEITISGRRGCAEHFQPGICIRSSPTRDLVN
jgi:hypothetical protein